MIKAFSGKLSQFYGVLYHMDAACPVSALSGIVPRWKIDYNSDDKQEFEIVWNSSVYLGR